MAAGCAHLSLAGSGIADNSGICLNCSRDYFSTQIDVVAEGAGLQPGAFTFLEYRKLCKPALYAPVIS